MIYYSTTHHTHTTLFPLSRVFVLGALPALPSFSVCPLFPLLCSFPVWCVFARYSCCCCFIKRPNVGRTLAKMHIWRRELGMDRHLPILL